MIVQIDPGALTVAPTTEAAIRLHAAARVYGAAPFWQVYQGDGGSVFSIMDGTAVLCSGDDAAEACLFLRMHPDVLRVRTDAATAAILSDNGFPRVATGTVLRRDPSPTGDSEAAAVPPRELYALLKEVFGAAVPPWDAWYADVFYRQKRGGCRLVGVHREGAVVAGAMTVAETDEHALCGGVATAPAWRGQGLARACVAALCRQTQKEGKPLWLAPQTAALRQVYEPMGFVPCGTWGEAAR